MPQRLTALLEELTQPEKLHLVGIIVSSLTSVVVAYIQNRQRKGDPKDHAPHRRHHTPKAGATTGH